MSPPSSVPGVAPAEPRPVSIGIAVIVDRGTVLVTRRPVGTHLEGWDEFPGGKCRESEAVEECVQREAMEEVGLHVRPIGLLSEERFTDGDRHLELFFFQCELLGPRETAGAEHRCPRWIPIERLDPARFPPANRRPILLLQSART